MVARISKFTRYASNKHEMAPPARKQRTPVLPDCIGLPNGATISRTALVLPGTFSIEEWQALGEKLAVFENGMQWWLGDWWHYGAHKYGDRKAKVKAKAEAKERVFPAFSTLMNWGWVAGKVAPSLRREGLSWSHHEVIARYDPDEQKKWLDLAELADWSVKQLGQAIYEARSWDGRIIADSVDTWAWQLRRACTSRGGFAYFNIELFSALPSSSLRSLADECDEAATWWANTGNQLRDLSARNAQTESETVAPSPHRAPTVIATERWIYEEADALRGASRTAAAASTRAGAQRQKPSRRSHSSRRSSDSSPPRSQRTAAAR